MALRLRTLTALRVIGVVSRLPQSSLGTRVPGALTSPFLVSTGTAHTHDAYKLTHMHTHVHT